MELNIAYAVLMTLSAVIFVQDVKNRSLHIVWPVLIFVTAITINVFSVHLHLIDLLYNIGFVAVNILGLTVYFSAKAKQVVNPIDSMIGLGDIVFFLALTPLFDLKSYILFFVLGLVFSLVLHLIVNAVYKKVKTVPLAGYMAVFLIGNIVVKHVLKIQWGL